MYVKNATDTCIWDIPSTISTSYVVRKPSDNTNTTGDTLDLVWNSDPQSGTINVQVGKNGSVKATASLNLTFVPKAAEPQNLTLDYPICQNVPVHMSIDVDEGYQTKYAPGALHLSWQHKQQGGEFAKDPEHGVAVTSDDDFAFIYTYSFKGYRGGEVMVTPFTCDASGYRTMPMSKPLTPFIIQNLYDGENTPSEKEIKPLKYEPAPPPPPGMEPTEEDPWKPAMNTDIGGSGYNTTICRWYSTEWNETNRVPQPEKYRDPGMGDGYAYLQFGEYYDFNTIENPTDYPEYYYRYEWTFNDGTDGTPKEFIWADDEMARFQHQGFGREKNRVILQVQEGDGYRNEYTVKVKVYCDACIEKGGHEADFTYETSMAFQRLDSIQDFKDQDNPQYQVNYEVETQGRVCAGLETELKISYNDDESAKNFNNTNATLYYLQVPANWEVSDGAGPSSNLEFKYLIGRTSWDGRPGDTAYVRVYPGNKCFRNMRDTNQNGKLSKVFVRNQPIKPTIYDPVVGAEIIGQYTNDRWEKYKELNKLDYPTQDDYISPHRVLFCNEIAGQSSVWLAANQSYGLYIRKDSIRSSTGPAWGVVDFDNRGLRSKYGVDIDQASIYKDSTSMTLSVFPGNHNEFKDADFKLGLYGRNECSGKDPMTGSDLTGDTAIFYIKVIDTLTVDTIISKVMAYAPWDTLCEGTKIDFASQYNRQYITWGSVEERGAPAMVETDRVDYEWDFPEGWIYDPAKSDNNQSSAVPSMIVGHGSGPVRLRFKNRCSFDVNPKFREKRVVVHPFVRVDIVGDTTPCRADSVVYKFKIAEGADAYQWTFPDDWEIISQSPVEGTNVGESSQASADEDSISISVRVGASDGNLYVVGQKTSAPGVYDVYGNLRTDACDFRFGNYEDHNRDSLGIRIKPWTGKPVVVGDFPVLGGTLDTLCAEKPYTFQVKKGADVDDSVFFRWIFPEDWTEDDYSEDRDTATFTTAAYDDSHSKLIRVASNRYDCEATNVGDTLDIPVFFTDTVPVTGRFLDAHPLNTMQNKRANPQPCEGDTVYYTLQPQGDEVLFSVFDIWSLNPPPSGTAVLADGEGDGESGGESGGEGDGDGDGDGDGEGGGEGGGEEPVTPDPDDPGHDDNDDEEESVEPHYDWAFLAASGWEILSKAPYHDTIKMVVGREAIILRAANVSHCDTSAFKFYSITPICKVVARGAITADRPDANLCEYEAVDFLFDTVPYATHYVFHYPWDVQTDTVRKADAEADREAGRLTEDGQYKIHFADTFDYQSGPVYLEAYNSCGVRPQNDTLQILSVLTPPEKPVLAKTDFSDFIYDAAHIIGSNLANPDTVLDTICLREPVVLEAAPNDKTVADAAGWRFHYAWLLTQADTSVKVFEKYPDAGAGLNGSDSLWTLTKVASPTKINYLYLTSRHETCQRFGDTLTVALRNIDTTALQGKDVIENYLKENSRKEGQGAKIQTKACADDGGDADYYLDLKGLDITGDHYYFRWRRDSAQPYGNVYNAGDQTLGGGKFVLRNAPADADGDGEPDWTTLDTLKITLPTDADTLEIQVVVVNRCGKEAHLPGLRIQTTDKIGDDEEYRVVRVTDHICDQEELTFKVVSYIASGTDTDGNTTYDEVDGIAKAGKYIWNAPWRSQSDTINGSGGFKITYDTAYKEGSIRVVPNNGCGDGHAADMAIIPNDILQPPLRVQPVPIMAQTLPTIDFAAGYDPAVAIEVLKDSLCLREKFEMAVQAELTPEVDASETAEADALRDAISYAWTTVYGKVDALVVYQDDSSKAYVNVPDFADSAYILYVAARRSVCQRYGDSLRIELFPMDTIRFINDLVEDDQPYNKFTVFTPGAIRDTRPTPALDTISTRPCVGSAHTYAIKPDFHWSLSPDYTPTFSWNGGKTGATDAGVLEGTADWRCDDVDLLPTVISIGHVGDDGDVLNLSIHAKNICNDPHPDSVSVSEPLPVRPLAQIDAAEQPETPYVVGSLCESDTIRVAVKPVKNAMGYIWKASWISKADTTVGPEMFYTDYRQENPNGTVTVYGFNDCGDGAVSGALELQPLLHIPDSVEAKWFSGLKKVDDTVYDTLCLHGDNLLWVKAALEDEDDGVFYDWQLLPAYDGLATLTGVGRDLEDGPDSVRVEPVSYNPDDRDMELHKGDNLYLMVTARRASCRLWSKPLYIALNMTDTVPVNGLGDILWYMYDPAMPDGKIKEDPSFPLCPGATIRLGVANEDAAPAYRWQFPDPTWRFAPNQDTTAAVVNIIVGVRSGVVRVSPMTDPDNRRCAYDAPVHPLTSDYITLKEALPAREFADGVNTAPCAGTELTYGVKTAADRDKVARYLWEFPQGWRVYDAAGNLIDTNSVELQDETCRVLPDSSAGIIRLYALSLCDEATNSFSYSQPADLAVSPMDTARLAIIADETVCKDSTLQMEIKALNEWTFGTGYGLTVTYIGSDATVITNPENPLTFDFPKAPDSSLILVGWHSGDSTRVTFTPRHTGGCSNVLPVTYALKADTVPVIHGRIIAPERICMGAGETFTAEADDIPEGVEVTYHWELPDGEGWEIVSGANAAVAVIKAGWYEGETELEKVIRCYPRAFCGTAAPFEYTIKVNPPANFDGTLQATLWPSQSRQASTDTCIGDDVAFKLDDQTMHAVSDGYVRYVWEKPAGWTRINETGGISDSLDRADFTVSKAGADTVRVRFLELNNPLSCGLSKPIEYAVAVRDSAPAARLTRPPFPCNTRIEVEFVLVPEDEIDTARWTWPTQYDPTAEVKTDENSHTVNNRLILKDEDRFTEAFDLAVHTTNICGSRDTVITVTPVDKIPDLPADILHVSHYCLEDSGYAYADKLTDYVGTGSEYHWLTDAMLTPLNDSLVHENDDPAGAETVAWLWFQGAAKATDTAQIRFYIQNDCNATDTVSVRTAPYTYAIWAKPGEDTVVYGRSGVSLAVDSTQYGTPVDYTYVWQPEDRVTLSDPAAPDDPATTFATKGLYNPKEYFRVIATERIDTTLPFYFGRSACKAYDTVEIFVDSTFAMAMAATDTVCMDALFEILANPYGGNSERYYFDWYRLESDSVYEPIADAGHTETLTLTADAPLIKLMVIGRDSTLVYADAEIPDVPEEQPEPEDTDIPDEPEPAEPVAPSLGEPLYVFSKVDTQYVEVEVFNVDAHLVQPGRDDISVPFGTKVRVVVETMGGSDRYAYLWTPDELLERHDSTMSTVSTLRLYEDGLVTVSVSDLATGCRDTLQVNIRMSDEIGDIPNAFSPNGDGINDIFMKGADVIIFDRFGRELFRSTNQEGWDGTYKGSTVSPGEYLYVVTIRKDGQEYVKKGTVAVFIK